MGALAIVSGVMAGVNALATIAGGQATKQMENYKAAQAKQAAGQAVATSQREAINSKRQAEFALSKGQNISAASGADPLGVTPTNIEGDVAGQGEYNALTALYTGNERAAGLNQEADTDIYQGKQAATASYFKAGGTLAQSGTSMYERYGPGTFGVAPANSPDMPWLQDVRSGNAAPNPYTSY